MERIISAKHDDVIKWKHLSHYWPFVRGIHRSPLNSQHKGQWRRALIFSLICAWINGWVWWFQTPSRSLCRHCSEYCKSCWCKTEQLIYSMTIVKCALTHYHNILNVYFPFARLHGELGHILQWYISKFEVWVLSNLLEFTRPSIWNE